MDRGTNFRRGPESPGHLTFGDRVLCPQTLNFTVSSHCQCGQSTLSPDTPSLSRPSNGKQPDRAWGQGPLSTRTVTHNVKLRVWGQRALSPGVRQEKAAQAGRLFL